MNRELILRICAIAVLGLLNATANATLIAIDFDDVTEAYVIKANLDVEGTRFSPNCHYDLVGPGRGGFADSKWIGFDGATCYPGETNDEYVGAPTAGAALFVDRYGERFSLLSLFQATTQWRVESSKGGMFQSFTGPFDPPTVAFNGEAWTDIEWLLFVAPGAGAPVGFDNLLLHVPEPGALPLLILGLATLAMARRKITWSANGASLALR